MLTNTTEKNNQIKNGQETLTEEKTQIAKEKTLNNIDNQGNTD